MTDEQRELLLTNNYSDYATSRAYYTLFYIADAFLEGEELSFFKHSAVISAFRLSPISH
jgi:uncharacterized protein (UPF0332 family)